MYAREFLYWLQGGFELGGLSALGVSELTCIRKHLELVDKTDQGDQPAPTTAFCGWLRGGIDFIKPGDAEQFAAVRQQLNDVFLHAIDKTYAEYAKLNEIHGKGVPRC